VLEDHEWQLSDRQQHYGTNEMAIPVKSVAALIADEMWHPFYVFQYFSIIIWVAGDQYYTYAVCILVITWFSIITSAVETHQNMKRLADIAHFSCMVGPQSPCANCTCFCVQLQCFPSVSYTFCTLSYGQVGVAYGQLAVLELHPQQRFVACV
jgi:hypothetical protein